MYSSICVYWVFKLSNVLFWSHYYSSLYIYRLFLNVQNLQQVTVFLFVKNGITSKVIELFIALFSSQVLHNTFSVEEVVSPFRQFRAKDKAVFLH